MSDEALKAEILRGVVGSAAYGTSIEGQGDRDEMGVFVESAERVCGWRALDHYIYRTEPEGARSEPGGLDLTMYSLRKFCRLAAQGNPSVVEFLWLPEYITRTEIGTELVALRDAFTSREAGARFLGYLTGQYLSLTGQRSKKVQRPELVARHGYDTKFAMHAARLTAQGIELLTEGRITIPVRQPDLGVLRDIRRGEPSYADVVAHIEDQKARLESLVADCALVADIDRIEAFLVSAHQRHWMSA